MAFHTIVKKMLGNLAKFTGRTIGDTASYAIGQATATVLEPYLRERVYAANVSRPNVKPAAIELIMAYYKGHTSLDYVSKELNELGFDGYVIDTLVKLNKPLIDIGALQALYNRGEISDGEFKTQTQAFGFDAAQSEHLLTLAGAIPSVGDFIRFAVREVFTPEIASKYGLFEDYPTELDKFAKMAGLDPEYAKQYWAAHWELPSMTMGFDMYHRDIISKGELIDLLKSLDVMPYWRDKIIELSERPYTRVDVRRMYKLGALSFEEMLRAYMDLGYSEEKAGKLAEFTVADVTEENRELSKGEILRGYGNGLLSEAETRGSLTALGYGDGEIEFYIAMADYQRSQTKITALISAVKKQYRYGNYDINDVVVELSKYAITDREIRYFLEIWDIENMDKPLIPSKAELKRFVKLGILTLDEYAVFLSNMGYPPQYVELYTSELKMTLA